MSTATNISATTGIPYEKIIEILDLLITIVGDVKLSEAKNFDQVQANAEELRAEGHENDPPTAGQ